MEINGFRIYVCEVVQLYYCNEALWYCSLFPKWKQTLGTASLSVKTKEILGNIFSHYLFYEEIIIFSVDWFFSPEFAESAWTCSRFLNPNCSSGHVECNFDNPADQVYLKIEKCSTFKKFWIKLGQAFIKIQTYKQLQFFLPKTFLWTYKKQFGQLCRNFFSPKSVSSGAVRYFFEKILALETWKLSYFWPLWPSL